MTTMRHTGNVIAHAIAPAEQTPKTITENMPETVHTPSDQPLIQAQAVSLTRGGKNILDKVSLTINAHDFITIVGPNGAGKSTLLKVIMGLIQPCTGSVQRRSNLRTGYVPQKAMVDRTIPISTRRFLSLRQNAERQILEQTAEQTGISPLMEKSLHTLSGGEMQRVLLCRALLHNPDLLIMDEPAQNLDISGQLAFYRQLDSIYRQRRISILMVSHDLHLVMSCTRKVICLYHHICCTGEPQNITRDPEFRKLFGNSMAGMLALYQHQHNHTHGDSDGHSDREPCKHG